MSAKMVCDGCGKEAPMIVGASGDYFKPSSWFTRSDKEGRQDACSRECIDRVAAKTGKTRVVLPL